MDHKITITCIQQLMEGQSGNVFRGTNKLSDVEAALRALNIDSTSSFGEFFKRFNLNAVLSPGDYEVLDLISPSEQILAATKFAKEIYDLKGDFVALTSGEDEGFLLYEIGTGCVYDVDVEDLEKLESGDFSPGWNDFYSFVHWYLGEG